MIYNIILILILISSIFLAAVYAGSEIGMYQLSRLRMRLGIERKKQSSIILAKALKDKSALLLTTLLGASLAEYIATSMVTLLLLTKLQNQLTVEALATLITAPLLFIWCELIPKNIFFSRADAIMPYTAPVLLVSQKIFRWCGLIAVLKIISSLFAKLVRSIPYDAASLEVMSSSHFKTLYYESREEAFLSKTQSEIISRMENISYLKVTTVMTPLNMVIAVDSRSDTNALMETLKKTTHTRLPVYQDTIDNITGFINIYDALLSPQPINDPGNFINPIPIISDDTIVEKAINIMQRHKYTLVLVARSTYGGKSKPLGIITMKDLMEELLGEITAA